MPGQVLKKRRLVNPGRRRRMTPAQIRFFGTKRQKAALRRNRGGIGSVSRKAFRRGGEGTRSARYRYKAESHARRRTEREDRGGYVRRNQGGIISQAEHAAARAIRSVERAAEDAIHSVTGAVNPGRRRRNVGEILTVIPANPGRKRRKNRMAAVRKRRRVVHNRRHNRTRNRRHNRAMARRHNRRSMNPKVIVRYRNRRHNRHYNRGGRRRRNPDVFGQDIGPAVGIVAGMLATGAGTKALSNVLPTTGLMAVLSTAGVGAGIGFMVSRVNRRFGGQMILGGLVLAVWELISQYFPALTLPFGVTATATPVTTTSGGMGLLTSSNFFVPQVNIPGSMATFVAPAAIPAPVVVSGAKMSGLGQYPRTMRRTGRLR